MAYLIDINFDNSIRLRKRCYLFEYDSIRFKLVQDNPRRWADHLLAVAPSDREADRECIFRAASKFLSALSWENGARITLWEAGGCSWPDGRSLRVAQPFARDFPRIPFGGNAIGYDLPRTIPHIQ